MPLERWLSLIGVTGVLLALYFLAPVTTEQWGSAVVRAIFAVLLLILLAVGLARQLRLAMLDGDRRIDGLVAAIITVIVVFAFAFYVLEVHRPHELAGLRTRLDALYFTASTMLTVGYGDVHATGQTARGLVLVQMVFDVVFVAAAAALLTTRVRSAAAGRTALAQGRSPAVGPRG